MRCSRCMQPWARGGTDMRRRFEIDGRPLDAALMRTPGGYALGIGGEVRDVELSPPGPDGARTLRVGERSWQVHVVRDGDATFVQVAGRSYAVRTIEPLTVFAHAGAATADLT